ncbi:MAG: MBL fold metallo-hydrolase [Planctomycetota bacterium]|nr:MBL fold metallo-hydrolase [Planctomycetota bacterium]
MSPSLCILASGSQGNASALRYPSGVILIDCGIGPRTAATRMKGLDICVGDVRAICLTHLDHDHFNINWVREIVRLGILIFCHERCAEGLRRRADSLQMAELIRTFNGSAFSPVDGISARPVAFPHDEQGSHGFVFEGFGSRIGFATDLGSVESSLHEAFTDLDLLAIESNYDPRMQRESARPWFLKQRIMGGRGHLSNQQAFDAVCAIFDECEAAARRLPEHIVLLHRSAECNCPNVVRQTFSRDARMAKRLVLAEQDRRTGWLCAERARPWVGSQMELQWG